MAEEQIKKIYSDNEEIKLKIQFATDLLVITFISGSIYDDRTLTIKGEALSWGFDAYPVSMMWARPFENEEIDESTKKQLMDIIVKENSKNITGFELLVNW